MAKDDYFVIVYQILAYLYKSLKAGELVDPDMLRHDSPLLNVNQRYWVFIIENMQEQGFIQGVELQFYLGHELKDAYLDKCRITPKGIEYLCENSTIKKAYRFLKDAKSIVPFELF